MVEQKYSFSDARLIANNLAGILAKLGQGDAANAMAILTHIVAYRANDYEINNMDDATKNYNNNLRLLRVYLDSDISFTSDKQTPSPTDSAESD